MKLCFFVSWCHVTSFSFSFVFRLKTRVSAVWSELAGMSSNDLLTDAQNQFDTFPRHFRIDVEVANLLRTC